MLTAKIRKYQFPACTHISTTGKLKFNWKLLLLNNWKFTLRRNNTFDLEESINSFSDERYNTRRSYNII